MKLRTGGSLQKEEPTNNITTWVRTNEAIGVSKAFCLYLDPIDAKNRSLKKEVEEIFIL
jgi:hypothetical protein